MRAALPGEIEVMNPVWAPVAASAFFRFATSAVTRSWPLYSIGPVTDGKSVAVRPVWMTVGSA